jgi:hypothetical protein
MTFRRTVFFVAAASLGATGAGCGLSSDLPSSTASVQLGFDVAPGETTDHFDYQISGNGLAPRDGAILLPDPNANLSGVIGGLPPGIGYHLGLTATSDDQGTFCSADVVFDVVSGTNTALTLILKCVNADTVRTIEVDGGGHVCPSMASTAVARAGSAVTLSASAFEFDDSQLQFLWETSAGVLATPHVAATTFTCGAAGAVQARVTVTDGVCDDSATFDIPCP